VEQGTASTAETDVVTSRVAHGDYERDEVLEVDGQPFFFNGVQLRVDKNEAVPRQRDARE
jgi:hypothetical protein